MTGARGIYLVRHGETEFNRDGRYQGQSDSPLTDLGIAQARRTGRVLAHELGTGFVQICTSPLGRAVQTAEIIAAALDCPEAPRPDTRLAEIGMGDWEGLTRTAVRSGWPDARKGRPGRNWIFQGPGSESLEAAVARLTAALEDARAANTACIIVSHANSGRLLRGLHAGMTGEEAMCLEAPQEAVFQLLSGCTVRRIDTEPEAYQDFQP